MIPTRDRWALLAAHALPSALDQDGVELEVVVVDDGSADGTAAGLERREEPRLRVLRHDGPRGVAAARNTGISAARGDWIAFLDDDDLWSPRKLRIQLDTAEQRNADFVYAAGVLVDRELRVLGADIFPVESELAARLLQGNVIPGGCSNVLVRTRLVREVGGFDEGLTYTEDWDLWLRLALAGRGVSCADVLVAHVEHEGNALFRYQPDVVSEYERVLTKHAAAGALPVREGRRRVLEWLAHEYGRAGHGRRASRAYLRVAWELRSPWHLARAIGTLPGLRHASAEIRGRRRVEDLDRPTRPDWLERYR